MKSSTSRFAVALSLAVLGFALCAGAQIGKPERPGARPRALTPEQKAKFAQKLAEIKANLPKVQQRADQEFLARRTQRAKQLSDRQAAQAAQVLAKLRALGQAPPKSTPPPPRGTYAVSGGTTQSGQKIAPSKVLSAVSSTPATGPVITSLTHNQGQPGDPIGVIGEYFPGSLCEVHFVVNPGMDLKAKTDNQNYYGISTSVPPVRGVLASYDGYVYVVVVSTSQKSNQVPFRFNPAVDYSSTLRITPDHVAWGGDMRCDINGPCTFDARWGSVSRSIVNSDFMAGSKGDDEFFKGYQLKNGWKVDQVQLIKQDTWNGDCGVSVKNEGTDSPYVVVHWWVNPAWVGAEMTPSYTGYVLTIWLRGPLGVPYQ